MTPAGELVSRVRITVVWAALGGGPLRGNRGRAFWRDGDGFNVSLSDAKGTWRDFPTEDGGGILDLIRRARGGTRGDAVSWLADAMGFHLDPFTPADRQQWVRRRRAAEARAERVTAWWWIRERELDEAKVRAAGLEDWAALETAAGLLYRLKTCGAAAIAERFTLELNADMGGTVNRVAAGRKHLAECDALAWALARLLMRTGAKGAQAA